MSGLTENELDRFLLKCKNTKGQDKKNALKAFIIRCYTGLTLKQVLSLTYGDIQDNHILKIERSNLELICKEISNELKELIGSGPSESKIIYPISEKTINGAILEIRSEIGIQRYITNYHAKPTYINFATNLNDDFSLPIYQPSDNLILTCRRCEILTPHTLKNINKNIEKIEYRCNYCDEHRSL
ncbi:MAG: hypothetical protein Q7W45_08500 [Bacteroidota bacterium]|nr:hypothetical protein [Bacteroidota bacterium]MDP3144282.1 hypothetical protein [Bacteroidota bacterium]